MSWFSKLRELGVASWAALELGFRKGRISKSDIAEFAATLVVNGKTEYGDLLLSLAGAESFDDDELLKLLATARSKLDSQFDAADPDDIWRLVILTTLREEDVSEETKIARLQELYAEFDYPEDMSPCSIYSNECIDPLQGLDQVIQKLRTTVLRHSSQ